MKNKDLAYYMACNYPYELVRDPDQGGFFARHPDLDGCAAQGETAEEAVANLDVARELWIETRLEDGLPVAEPSAEKPSGRVSLRMPSSLHGQLISMAQRQGVSLNLLLNMILAEYVGGAGSRVRLECVVDQLERLAADLQSAGLSSAGVYQTPESPNHQWGEVAEPPPPRHR